MHVGFDPETGEFSGLPDTWARILTQSNLSMNETKNNPEAVLQVLNFYANNTKHEQKWMGQGWSNENLPSLQHFSVPKNGHQPMGGRLPPKPMPRDRIPSSSDDSSSDSEDLEPPKPPPRPDHTRSIYTKSLIVEQPLKLPGQFGEEDTNHVRSSTVLDENGVARRVKTDRQKKKMSEKEVLDILRTIVTIGDPELRYADFKKIGQVHKSEISFC